MLVKNLDNLIGDIYRDSIDAKRRGDYDQAHYMYRKLRADHGLELFYEVELRAPFKFVHPIGAVLGRAHYAPYMVFYQNCGVGSDIDGNKPVFYGPCVLFPGARVLGRVTVGKNVMITPGTCVSATEKNPITIPDDVVVFQRVQEDGTMGVGWKPTKRNVKLRFFNVKPDETWVSSDGV